MSTCPAIPDDCPANLGDVMTREVVTVGPDDTLKRIREIFEQHPFHHVIVVDKGRVVGVISDRDVLRHLSPFIGKTFMERQQDVNTLNRRAHQIMHRRPITATDDTPVEVGTKMLLDHDISCLPIVDATSTLKGVVTWRDVMPFCFRCLRPAA